MGDPKREKREPLAGPQGLIDLLGRPQLPPAVEGTAETLGLSAKPLSPEQMQQRAATYREANPQQPSADSFDAVLERGLKEQGGGESTSGTVGIYKNILSGVNAGIDTHPMTPMATPGVSVLGEGENYHPLGGAQGKENYRSAYNEEPTVQAIMDAQSASEEQNKALLGFHRAESARQQQSMAALMARRAEDQAEEQRRAAYLDEQSQRVTAKLLNTNAYWENPGNIISAIAFSLMPIAGGDPAAGARLINQAVESDFNRRRLAADAYLGELRSNLSEYRKIAGDRQAGDLLAESEARRIAANQIEQIGLKFASPISRAKAEAAAQDQRQRAAQARMQAYKMGVYVPPQALPAPIVNAYRQGGRDGIGYHPYETTPSGPGAATGGSVSSRGVTYPTTASSAPGISGTTMSAMAANPREALRQVLASGRGPNGRDMSPEQIGQLIGAVNLQRMLQYKRVGKDVNEEMAKLTAEDNKAAGEVGKVATPILGLATQVRGMQRDMKLISNAYLAAGKDPNSFLSDLHTGVGTGLADTIQKLRERYSKPGTKEEQFSKDLLSSANTFRQRYNMLRTEFAHKKFGGSQTDNELTNLESIVSKNPSWQQLDGFISRLSEATQADIEGALASSPSPTGAFIWMAQNPGFQMNKLANPGIPSR